MVLQNTIDIIVNISTLEGIWVHEKMLHKRLPHAKKFSANQLLTQSIRSSNQVFISLEKRKKDPVKQGMFQVLDTIYMDTYGKGEILLQQNP